jgi:glutamyl-tRNA synthetase
VPLALNAEGKRLAKRDGAVTLHDLGTSRTLSLITASLNRPAASLTELLDGFDPAALPRTPWVYRPQ